MAIFVAERYLPDGSSPSLSVDADGVDRSAAATGGVIRLVTVYLPGDEICLYVFETDDLEPHEDPEVGRVRIDAACRQAGFEPDRVSPAVLYERPARASDQPSRSTRPGGQS